MRRVGGLLGACFVFVALLGGFALPASGAQPSSVAVDFYEDEFGFTEEVAADRVAAQGYAFPLSSALPKALGDEFSSLEFVTRAGYFKVRVRTEQGVASAEKVFETENVPVPKQIEVVGFNEAELNQRVGELSKALARATKQRKALVSVIAGRPMISTSATLSSAERRRISRFSDDRFGTATRVVDERALRGHTEACSNGYCNDIVAGEYLDGYEPVWLPCSTGFVGRDSNGRHMVLTAGHCLISGPELWLNWKTCYGGGSPCGFAGHAIRSEFVFNSGGDHGLLRYDEVASDFGIASKYADWNTGSPVTVGASFVNTPPTGIVVCLNAVSAYSGDGEQTCGTIASNNVPATVGVTTVNGTLGITGACTDYGMSGGPWVFDFLGIKVATGTHVGSSSFSGCGGTAFAEPITRSKAYYGITVP